MAFTKLLGVFLAVAMLCTATALPRTAGAQSIGITVSFGPPAIPYYVQPAAPGPNYIWTPGYWAYDPNNAWGPNNGYYWVPGTWVFAPQAGLLWTPGYWGWNGIAFVFNSGFWGTQVGWYGGVNYGYGYYGRGYDGGRWHDNQFVYNVAVTNVNRTYIRNVYNDPSVRVSTWNRTSYNGGRGGLAYRAPANMAAIRNQRAYGPTNVQIQHAHYAATNRANFVVQNHGRPEQPAMTHPIQHAYAPQAHAAPQQHYAAPVQHAYAAPQHNAAPQAHAAPAQHYAAPQQQHAAPAQHYAPAAPHAAGPPHGGAPGGAPDKGQPAQGGHDDHQHG